MIQYLLALSNSLQHADLREMLVKTFLETASIQLLLNSKYKIPSVILNKNDPAPLKVLSRRVTWTSLISQAAAFA